MNSSERWVWLPLRLGVAAVVLGFMVIGALWYGAGEQAYATTQLPYVLVAGGAGTGLVGAGSAVALAQRHRLDRRRVEESTARVLVASARLSDVRSRKREASA